MQRFSRKICAKKSWKTWLRIIDFFIKKQTNQKLYENETVATLNKKNLNLKLT